MRVLVACEFSGIVRDAFAARGHDAWSCDLLPTERPGQHIQGDVLNYLLPEQRIWEGPIELSWPSALLSPYFHGWDLMIAHPPCTNLAVSGARYFAAKKADGRQDAALEFVRKLLDAPIPRICLENPVSIISTRIRKPDQIIQPWQFGHPESKATCLWLKGLPRLTPTHILHPTRFGTSKMVSVRMLSESLFPSGRMISGVLPRWENQTASGQNKLGPSADRRKIRSRTYLGVAEAMAEQWGGGGGVKPDCNYREVLPCGCKLGHSTVLHFCKNHLGKSYYELLQEIANLGAEIDRQVEARTTEILMAMGVMREKCAQDCEMRSKRCDTRSRRLFDLFEKELSRENLFASTELSEEAASIRSIDVSKMGRGSWDSVIPSPDGPEKSGAGSGARGDAAFQSTLAAMEAARDAILDEVEASEDIDQAIAAIDAIDLSQIAATPPASAGKEG